MFLITVPFLGDLALVNVVPDFDIKCGKLKMWHCVRATHGAVHIWCSAHVLSCTNQGAPWT